MPQHLASHRSRYASYNLNLQHQHAKPSTDLSEFSFVSADSVFATVSRVAVEFLFHPEPVDPVTALRLNLILHAETIGQAVDAWVGQLDQQLGEAVTMSLLNLLATPDGRYREELSSNCGCDNEIVHRFLTLMQNHILEEEGRLKLLDTVLYSDGST